MLKVFSSFCFVLVFAVFGIAQDKPKLGTKVDPQVQFPGDGRRPAYTTAGIPFEYSFSWSALPRPTSALETAIIKANRFKSERLTYVLIRLTHSEEHVKDLEKWAEPDLLYRSLLELRADKLEAGIAFIQWKALCALVGVEFIKANKDTATDYQLALFALWESSRHTDEIVFGIVLSPDKELDRLLQKLSKYKKMHRLKKGK